MGDYRPPVRTDKKSAQARWKVLQSEGAVPALMKKKKTRIRWTKAMDALLVSLRQEGVPWQEAAVRLGVSLYAACGAECAAAMSGCERGGGGDYAPGRIAPKTGREDGDEL